MNTIPYAKLRRNIMMMPNGSIKTKQLEILDAIQKARLPNKLEIKVCDKNPVKAVIEYSGKKITGKSSKENSSLEYQKASAINDAVVKDPALMKQYVAGHMGLYQKFNETPRRIPDFTAMTVKDILYLFSNAYSIWEQRDMGCQTYLLIKK